MMNLKHMDEIIINWCDKPTGTIHPTDQLKMILKIKGLRKGHTCTYNVDNGEVF